MSKVLISSNEIYYQYQNLGCNDTIVFCNSLGSDHTIWESVIAQLQSSYNVLSYDCRGHGQSTSTTDSFTITDLGSDVLSLLDHLSVGKVQFCGISMGSLIGQWLAINHPDRFNKVVLAGAAAKFGERNAWTIRIEKAKAEGVASLSGAIAQRWFTPEYREQNQNVVDDIIKKYNATSVAGYAGCCSAIRDCDFTNGLSLIKVKTLIISGSEDVVATVEDGDYLSQNILDSSHNSIHAAHLSCVENPKAFADEIIKFYQDN